MKNKIFYTYVHCRKDDGFVFYVGKGHNRRAWDFSKRNRYWKNVHSKYGTIVKIVKQFDNESEALEHEKELIKLMRGLGFDLTNMTDGGEGTCGLKKSQKECQEISDRVKIYFQDPKNIKRSSNSQRTYLENNPDALEKRRQVMLDYYSKHGNVELISDIRKKFYEDNPQALEVLRRKHKEHFDNPLNREIHSLKLKEYYSDPANRQKTKDAKSKLHFIHLATNQEFFSYNEAGRCLKLSHTTVRKRLLLGEGYVDLLKIGKGDLNG